MRKFLRPALIALGLLTAAPLALSLASPRELALFAGAMGIGQGVSGGIANYILSIGRTGQLSQTAKIKAFNERWPSQRRQDFQNVMASPPTVTTSLTPTISGQFFPSGTGDFNNGTQSPGTSQFVYSRGSFLLGGGATSNVAGTVGFTNVTNTNTPSYGANTFGVSFMYTGTAFEVAVGQGSNYFLVKVDDQYTTLTPISTGTSGNATLNYIKFAFAGSAQHRIDIIGEGIFVFCGVNIGAIDTITAAPLRGPTVVVEGDSFTYGTGASGFAANNFVAALADAEGWDNVVASGVGGTGYLATNGGTAPTFRGRFANDVVSFNPDIVFIVGSTNDWGASPSAIGAEATLLYQQAVASLPNALIFAVPTATGGVNRMTPNALAVYAAMKAAAAANGVIWLDPTSMPMPVGITPNSGTLNASYSSGQSGVTGMNFNSTSASVITGTPQVGSTILIDGERLQILGAPTHISASVWNYTFDGVTQVAHSAGATWTQVGGSAWTGHGYLGATTGYGNSDLDVYTDGTHPSTAGHLMLGVTIDELFRQATTPNG